MRQPSASPTHLKWAGLTFEQIRSVLLKTLLFCRVCVLVILMIIVCVLACFDTLGTPCCKTCDLANELYPCSTSWHYIRPTDHKAWFWYEDKPLPYGLMASISNATAPSEYKYSFLFLQANEGATVKVLTFVQSTGKKVRAGPNAVRVAENAEAALHF